LKEYVIEEKDVRAIIDYLKTRPYQEVFQGINLLTSLKEVEKPKVE